MKTLVFIFHDMIADITEISDILIPARKVSSDLERKIHSKIEEMIRRSVPSWYIFIAKRIKFFARRIRVERREYPGDMKTEYSIFFFGVQVEKIIVLYTDLVRM